MATWPSTLPDKVLQDGYSETFPDLVIRVKMGTGPDHVRKRLSYNVTPINCQLSLTSSEVEIFKTLYVGTCAGGAIPFYWVHPRTGASVTFMFTGPPVITPQGGLYYLVKFGLEIQP